MKYYNGFILWFVSLDPFRPEVLLHCVFSKKVAHEWKWIHFLNWKRETSKCKPFSYSSIWKVETTWEYYFFLVFVETFEHRRNRIMHWFQIAIAACFLLTTNYYFAIFITAQLSFSLVMFCYYEHAAKRTTYDTLIFLRIEKSWGPLQQSSM